jgi:DnaK suppressor protein
MATAMNRVDDTNTAGRNAANDADGYRPDADEPFMSLKQQAYFRTKLRSCATRRKRCRSCRWIRFAKPT